MFSIKDLRLQSLYITHTKDKIAPPVSATVVAENVSLVSLYVQVLTNCLVIVQIIIYFGNRGLAAKI